MANNYSEKRGLHVLACVEETTINRSLPDNRQKRYIMKRTLINRNAECLKSFPKRNSKFTMIELLVVITIITILAGILLPAMKSVLDKAREINCMNNLKQSVLATLSYTDDNDSWLMLYKHGWWRSLIVNGYLSESKIFTCPSFEFCPGGIPVSYNFPGYQSYKVAGKKLGIFKGPANYCMYVEHRSTDRHTYRDWGAEPPYDSWKWEINTSYPHNLWMNVAMLDGHLVKAKYTAMPNSTNAYFKTKGWYTCLSNVNPPYPGSF